MLERLDAIEDFRENVAAFKEVLCGHVGIYPAAIGSVDEAIIGLSYLGGERFFNTPFAADQLIGSLSLMKRDAVVALLQGRTRYEDEALVKDLLREKPLRGEKILDLGCGIQPSYARACRAFGAEVWMVDVVSPEQIRDFSKGKRFLALERQFYIPLDLNREDALEVIEVRAGRDFSIVTEAHSRTGWDWSKSQLDRSVKPNSGWRSEGYFSHQRDHQDYEPLLKIGGVFLDVMNDLVSEDDAVLVKT